MQKNVYLLFFFSFFACTGQLYVMSSSSSSDEETPLLYESVWGKKSSEETSMHGEDIPTEGILQKIVAGLLIFMKDSNPDDPEQNKDDQYHDSDKSNLCCCGICK